MSGLFSRQGQRKDAKLLPISSQKSKISPFYEEKNGFAQINIWWRNNTAVYLWTTTELKLFSEEVKRLYWLLVFRPDWTQRRAYLFSRMFIDVLSGFWDDFFQWRMLEELKEGVIFEDFWKEALKYRQKYEEVSGYRYTSCHSNQKTYSEKHQC